MSKGNAIARIIIFAVLIVVLAGVLLSALGYGVFKDWFQNWNLPGVTLNTVHYEDEDSYTIGERTEKPAALKRVEIHWVAGTVTVTALKGSTLTCREEGSTGDDNAMRTRLVDGVLTIQYAKSGFSISKPVKKDLTVEIPWVLMDDPIDMTVESVSAKVTITETDTRDLSLQSVNGDMELNRVISQNISLETVSGDVTVVSSVILDRVEVESVSGDADLDLAGMPSALSCETVSGDVTWALPETDFEVKFSKISGSFSSDLAFTEKDGVRRFGKGGPRFEMETVSGDLTVNKR